MTLALVDYGAGNLASVRKGLAAAGAADLRTVRDPGGLGHATGIVIPGVGHFGATRTLDESWRRVLRDRIECEVPVLGICLGMQWLFAGSDEAPGVRGYGLFDGRCTRLEPGPQEKIPHVGWNALRVTAPSRILRGVPDGSFVYFTHSYAAPVTSVSVATASHGSPFAAVVEAGRVFGVQFHPEKSGAAGLAILRAFVETVNAG
jgi:glutamine amidotransferase